MAKPFTIKLVITFIAYVFIAGVCIFFHESWGDELQTWNLIKGSGSIFELLINLRFDGHPSVWYIILFLFSKISHSLFIIKLNAYILSIILAYIFIFYSVFNFEIKLLTLSGYYFLFEYNVFSRNYSLAIIMAFMLCVLLRSDFKKHIISYYLILFLLANTHLLAMFLALSFHLVFILKLRNSRLNNATLLSHVFFGIFVVFSGLIYVYSGADFNSSLSHSLQSWHKGHLVLTAQLPLRAFINLPSWWTYNFWNTNAIWELCSKTTFLKIGVLLFSLGIAIVVIILFASSRKALLMFLINIVGLFALAAVAPMINARYVGFIFIAFIVSLWLNWEELNLSKLQLKIVYFIFFLQIPGTFIALSRDWTSKFSQINELNSIIKNVPTNREIVTDYWGLNYLSSVRDSAFYCVESKKKQSFLVLNSSTLSSLINPTAYTNGINYFFQKSKQMDVFFLCIMPPIELNKRDSVLNYNYKIELIDSRQGSIEKFSNLFLYRIKPRLLN